MKQASTSRNAAHRRNTETRMQAIKEVLKKHAEADTSNPPWYNKQFLFLLLFNAFYKRNDRHNFLLLNSYETFLSTINHKT